MNYCTAKAKENDETRKRKLHIHTVHLRNPKYNQNKQFPFTVTRYIDSLIYRRLCCV